MKRTILISFLAVALLAAAAFAMQHGCQYCGMDLMKFAHSRVTINYTDETKVDTCSVHCTAVDLALNIDKTPESIMVGDFNTKELIDSESAYWIIGGKKMGVMTKRAKWAFKSRDDAKAFKKEQGGKLANFDKVMEAAYNDMYEDTKMIREKRKKMKMKGMKH
jgi:nitrous oxide reductase accessory protein NosL